MMFDKHLHWKTLSLKIMIYSTKISRGLTAISETLLLELVWYFEFKVHTKTDTFWNGI